MQRISGLVAIMLLLFPSLVQRLDAQVPTPRQALDQVSTIVGLINEEGLECVACSRKPQQGGTTAARFDLSVDVAEIKQLDQLMRSFSREWRLEMHAFSLSVGFGKPGLPINCKLDFSLHPTSEGLADAGTSYLLKPILQIPVFDLQRVDDRGIRLFAYQHETSSRHTSLQVVADSFAEMENFADQTEFTPYGRSLSFSSVQGQPILTLELTSNADFLPHHTFLALAKKLGNDTEVREISPTPVTMGTKPGYKLLLRLGEAGIAPVLSVLRTIPDLGMTAMEIRRMRYGESDNFIWEGTFQAGFEAGAWPETTLPLSAPWSGPVVLSWTPTREEIIADMPAHAAISAGAGLGEAPISTGDRDLRPLLDFLRQLGYELSQTSRMPAEKLLFVKTALLHADSAADDRQDVTSLSGVAEILDRRVSSRGLEYQLRCQITRLPLLVERLAPRENSHLAGFNFSFKPEKASIYFNARVLDSPSPTTSGAYRLLHAFTNAGLPWFLADYALADGVILDGLEFKPPQSFLLSGRTLKSSRIFSSLFPELQMIPGVSELFFREGKYRDTKMGRLMSFVVTGNFSPADDR